MLRRYNKFIILIILLLVVTGCEKKDEKTVMSIHEHLEETVILEKGFENVQDPILTAEKTEQQYYEEIIKLSLEEYDKIQELTSKAIESAEQRKTLIDQEKESLTLAYKEFELIVPLTEELEDSEIKKNSKDLVDKMKERYASYQVLNEEYNKGIEADIKLYELLQKKDISISDLEKHIEQLNKQYQLIMDAKDDFNKKTENYNESKKAFYKVTELDVQIEY
jgi:hypothetical protein